MFLRFLILYVVCIIFILAYQLSIVLLYELLIGVRIMGLVGVGGFLFSFGVCVRDSVFFDYLGTGQELQRGLLVIELCFLKLFGLQQSEFLFCGLFVVEYFSWCFFKVDRSLFFDLFVRFFLIWFLRVFLFSFYQVSLCLSWFRVYGFFLLFKYVEFQRVLGILYLLFSLFGTFFSQGF